MKKVHSLFNAHPASVNESYGTHLMVSWSFGWRMLVGAGACLVHGLFPFLCVSTGSSTIRALYDRMVTHRLRNDTASQATPHTSS